MHSISIFPPASFQAASLQAKHSAPNEKQALSFAGTSLDSFHKTPQSQPIKTVKFTGYSDLHEAASVGDVRKVQELLQGADADYLNEQDEYGDTPLHLAAMEGHRSIVSALLGKSGIDFSLRNYNGETARDQAVINNNYAVVHQLDQRQGRAPGTMRTGN